MALFTGVADEVASLLRMFQLEIARLHLRELRLDLHMRVPENIVRPLGGVAHKVRGKMHATARMVPAMHLK